MNLGRELASVARELLAEGTVQHTLDRIVQLAVSTIPGCDDAGVSLLTPGGIRTPAATSQVVRDADAPQYETGQGPCINATRQRELETAIETRTTIGEAIGILMERHGLTPDAGFATLTKASQDHNIKLRDLAARIPRIGDLP